ncbi:MAG: APC family permease [Syntrophobacteraceae bacterium]|jgi:amino acid transporter
MSLLDKLFGRPLASSEAQKEKINAWTGVPVLGLDALASTGYGPEAGLTILLPLGLLGLQYFPIILLVIVMKLLTLYLSYRQTIAAYPGGGGAYTVASDNLGIHMGLWAAVMLLLDYLLNVCVGIAAGIGAVVSAIPMLQPYTLELCLLVLLTLTIINLRGVRQTGMVFIVPVIVFVVCLGFTLVLGLLSTWLNGGHPQPVVPPPAIPQATATVTSWLLLCAFANSATALTGIEAVSNGVPLFREPAVPNAQRTLTVIMLILALFLLAIGYLVPHYHIGAMDEAQPGYQTILSQLVAAVAGRGVFYYVSLAAIFIVLTYSAQTSFTNFPRVCRLLAEDGFLPPYFANAGRRLVFSHGIIFLSVCSGLLLIAFRGLTDALIPLFAVGAFGAFLFSQAGMVVHWLRKRGRGYRIALAYNALGAVTTAAALVVIIAAKFMEGAWMTVIFVPTLVFLLQAIKRHYQKVSRKVDKPLELQAAKLQHPIVIVPIYCWDRVAERAVRFGLLLSDEVIAIHVSTDEDDQQLLRKLWTEKVEKPAKAAGFAVPRLEIISSPYRRIDQPILDFVQETRKKNRNRLIAVILPQLVEPHWYQYVLHNLHAAWLRTSLFLQRDQYTVVVDIPWYLQD